MIQEKNYITPDVKVADLFQHNPFFMLLTGHFGINFGMSDKSISQVCAEQKINTDLFLKFANAFNGYSPAEKSDYSIEDTVTIINYLKKCHTYYIEEKYPEIRKYIEQMLSLNKDPEALLVDHFFSKYFDEVREHLNYENQVVFPYVLNLHERVNKKKTTINNIKYSVKEYKEQHDDIEEKLTDLKKLLIKYLPSGKDQRARRKLLFSLFELEYDLNFHSKIEDLILIPLVEQMERGLNKK